jgi:Na+:H+ antiporter, NhaA family
MARRRPTTRLLGRLPIPEARRIARALRAETVGGAILLTATVVALVWANSPWHAAYDSVRDTHVGISAWHVDLSLEAWAADGLLAIFFLVAGLELKHELVLGDLADPAKAVLPVVAALCGVAVPALLYIGVSLGAGGGVTRGWAIPTATDIAFALAVLAVVGGHLPSPLRAFLLTLAVVDDLVAITIIAVFYTSGLSVVPLVLAVPALAAYAIAVRRRPGWWWLYLPLGLLTWGFVHASGVHATVAGVLLGLVVPVKDGHPERSGAAARSTADRFEHRLRPISAGLAVPAFALLSAGVRLGGPSGGLGAALRDPAAVGVVVGLVAGKASGVFGGTWLVARFTGAELDDELHWADIAGVSLLSGVGFTVSLLIGELAFGSGSPHDDHVKVGVLVGSVLAALLATAVLRPRDRAYRRRLH